MRNTILILIFLPAFAAAQNVGQFGYVYAKDSLRLKAIVDSISRDTNLSAASHRKLLTALSAKKYSDYHIGSRSASVAAPTNGQVWKWVSANNRWEPSTDATSGGTVVATDTIWSAKGDLAVATGNDAAVKLAVGADGTVLTADSGEPTGVKWAAVGAGDILQGGNTFAAPVVIGTNDNYSANIEVNNVTAVTVGTDYSLTTTANVAATNTATSRLIVATNTTGTANTGFGGGVLFRGETNPTADRDMAGIYATWTNATDVSREAKVGFHLGDNAGALAEIANFNVSGSSTGQFSLGSATPALFTNGGITTAASYTVGNSSQSLTLGGSSGTVSVISTQASTSAIQLRAGGSAAGASVNIGGLTKTHTSGTTHNFYITNGYTAGSGTGEFNAITIATPIYQTASSGAIRGVYINPTLTNVNSYFGVSLPFNNANAKGIYQSGALTTNNFAGQTRIGSTSAPARMLDVTGELRVSDLTTDNPTGLVGADADGDFARVKLGAGLTISNDTISAAAGSFTGSGTAGQVAYWSNSTTLTGESAHYWDASNDRLGVNTSAPDNKVTVKTNTSTDGIQIESDGTTDQDPGWLRFKTTQSGPYTQYGWMTLDGFSNGGASPEGQAYIFKLQTTGYSVNTPLSLYKNQAIFSAASQFYITNNANGRFIFSVPSAYDHNFQNNVLVTGSSFTTADTSTRLRVIGRTQTANTYSARLYDGNAQLAFSVRDDRKAGFNASTLDAVVNMWGLGATSSTYGLIVTNSSGTTSTASLVVRDDNRVGIRTNAPQTPLNVVGTGTTSSSTALLVEGSGGQDNFKTRDDGVNIGQGFAMESNAPTIAFGLASGTGPTNDLCQGGANGFILFFTTGTSPTTNSAIFTATLPKFYPNGVVATWSCGDTDCLDEAPDIYISGTGNNSVTLSTRSTLTASTAYVVYVTCFGY